MAGKIEVGSWVRLNFKALARRMPEMREWEGTVEGFCLFPLKGEENRDKWSRRVRVDWGIRREGHPDFVWFEQEGDLVLS